MYIDRALRFFSAEVAGSAVTAAEYAPPELVLWAAGRAVSKLVTVATVLQTRLRECSGVSVALRHRAWREMETVASVGNHCGLEIIVQLPATTQSCNEM